MLGISFYRKIPALLIAVTAVGMLTGAAPVNFSNAPYQLVIDARNSTYHAEFQLEITRTPTFTKLRVGRLTSTQYHKLEANPAYAAAQQAAETAVADKQLAPTQHEEAVSRAVERLREVREPYRLYQRDSVLLNPDTHAALTSLFDSVRNAPVEVLARKDYRIIMDGTTVLVRVRANGETEKRVAVGSPEATSHPLVYRLMHETLLAYRQARPETFLTKRVAVGY